MTSTLPQINSVDLAWIADFVRSSTKNVADVNMGHDNNNVNHTMELLDELNLDSKDIRSYAWYHGSISRDESQQIIQENGQFLVRDDHSNPGNYVLTCKHDERILHFKINKIIIQPNTVYERVQYQLEDNAFDTIQDLIIFYLGNKCITAASKAVIKEPCNRIRPLRYSAKNNENSPRNEENHVSHFEHEDEVENYLSRQVKKLANLAKSKFDVDNFETSLFSESENEQLETPVLEKIRLILLGKSPKQLATHLTKIDGDLLLSGKNGGCPSNLDLIFLTESHIIRRHLIERVECMRLFVASTILMTTNNFERCEIMKRWIEIAIETRTAMGNLFGFYNILLGLTIAQIQRLETTLCLLRQKYTDTAHSFEADQVPFMKSMTLCNHAEAPNTTIPHILPLVLLNEKTDTDFKEELNSNSNLNSNEPNIQTLQTICFEFNKRDSIEFGLNTFQKQLNLSLQIWKNHSAYTGCFQSLMKEDGSIEKLDDLTLDMFRTEFHLRFLWGSKRACLSPKDRYEQLGQVFDALFQKILNEPSSEL